MRPVQRFSDEYLERTRGMTPEQAVRFVEESRKLYFAAAKPEKSRLISLKVPVSLLQAFRSKAESQNLRYQTQIKKLMESWLKTPS